MQLDTRSRFQTCKMDFVREANVKFGNNPRESQGGGNIPVNARFYHHHAVKIKEYARRDVIKRTRLHYARKRAPHFVLYVTSCVHYSVISVLVQQFGNAELASALTHFCYSSANRNQLTRTI